MVKLEPKLTLSFTSGCSPKAEWWIAYHIKSKSEGLVPKIYVSKIDTLNTFP